MFTRPPSLDPDPLYSWQNPKSILADRSRYLRRGTLSGRFRRLLAEAAIAHRLLMAEHQVGSALLPVRWADNYRRGFAPLRKTLLSDSRRTHISTSHHNQVHPDSPATSALRDAGYPPTSRSPRTSGHGVMPYTRGVLNAPAIASAQRES